MTLRSYWTKSLYHKSLNSIYVLYSRNEHTRKKSVLITPDALDEFTTKLLAKKTTKWDMAKERLTKLQMKDCKLATKVAFKRDVNSLNRDALDAAFQSALDDNNKNNLTFLIEECTKHKVTPSVIILTNLLCYFSTRGNREILDTIIKLYEVVNPEILETNSNFAHYIAEAISVNGDTNTALALFEKVYVENTFLRRRIQLMLKNVISEVVDNRSEAAIVALLRFTEGLFLNHKDLYPLACMWEACFLSEWFSEQMLSIEILKRHKILFGTITERINFLVNLSLRKQHFDVVLRLLEYLLENKFQSQYSVVIITMFDYNYKRGNLKTCMDIVNWSKKYEISLPGSFDDKYLDLILKQMRNDLMEKVVEKKLVNEFKF